MDLKEKEHEMKHALQERTLKGSILDIAQSNSISIAKVFMSIDRLILCDTSGSMHDHCSDGRSKYANMLDELAALQREDAGKTGVFSFSNDVVFCPTGVPTFLNGGTYVGKALEYIKQVDGTGIKIILISDGIPSDITQTFEVAVTFETPIDTIYIGSELDSNRGRETLARISELSGNPSNRGKSWSTTADVIRDAIKLLSSGS